MMGLYTAKPPQGYSENINKEKTLLSDKILALIFFYGVVIMAPNCKKIRYSQFFECFSV
jgi:hypothetical protein